MIGTLSRAKGLRSHSRFSLDLVTKIVDGPERNSGDLCHARGDRKTTRRRVTSVRSNRREMRETRRFVTESSSDSCSMRVFINTGRRPDLSSRARCPGPRSGERRGTRVTNEHKSVTKKKHRFSVIFDTHRIIATKTKIDY